MCVLAKKYSIFLEDYFIKCIKNAFFFLPVQGSPKNIPNVIYTF